MLFFAGADFPLERFEPDFVRGVIRYEASVAAAVEVVLLAEVVLVNEAESDACNPDKKER